MIPLKGAIDKCHCKNSNSATIARTAPKHFTTRKSCREGCAKAATVSGALRMTDAERKSIYAKLLGDVSMFQPGDIARTVLEEVALRQLNDLESVIDEILEEARREREAV